MAVARRNVDWVDRRFALGSRVDQEVRGIEIVLTGNADQREQGISGPLPPDAGTFPLVGQTGQSDEIHSPEACAKSVVSRI